jgi:HEAT repeat protein
VGVAHDRPRRYLPAAITAGLVAVAILVLIYCFNALRHGGIPAGGARTGTPELKANVSKGPSAKSVAGVKSVEVSIPDLDGQREPTEEELIRAAIERYLAELRGATAANPDKALMYLQNKAALEELLRNLPASAIPLIEQLLREESDDLCRRVLIYGLADIGTDEAARVLRDHFLNHIHDEARGVEMRHLIRALGMCDTAKAYDVLVDLLGAGDEAVRALRPNYVEALGKHRRGSEALPIFFDLLANDGHDMVRNKAAQAVKNVAKRDPQAAAPTLATLIESYQSEKTRQLDRRASGIEPVPYIKQTTLGAIGQLGDPAAVPFLLEVGTTESLDERLSAAAALSRIGGSEAMAALKEILANTDAKRALVDAIGLLREPRAIPFFLDVATTADSVDVRRSALSAITLVGGEEAVDALHQVLSVNQSEAVRKEATACLERLTRGRG